MEEPDPGTKNAVHTDCPGQPSQSPPQENSGMDSVTRWGIDWWGTIAINDPTNIRFYLCTSISNNVLCSLIKNKLLNFYNLSFKSYI